MAMQHPTQNQNFNHRASIDFASFRSTCPPGQSTPQRLCTRIHRQSYFDRYDYALILLVKAVRQLTQALQLPAKEV